MSLGLRIRQLRQSRGLTQQQLGSPDLSKSFISLVERDRTRPSVATLAFLARRLGTSVDALLGQEGHMPETAAASLLALSDDATRKRDVATAAKLLDAAEFLGEKFALEETKREAALQRAQVAFEQQAFEDAWARLAASKDDAESARDHWRQGRALVLMGRIKIRARDYREAADLLERALAVLRTARASRDPVRAHALIFLGTSLVWLNRLEDALRRYREAAASDVAKRDPAVRGRAEWGIGWVQRKLGRLDEARTSLLHARESFEAAEELEDLLRVLQNIGQLDHEEGRPREALRHFHHALRVMERLQRPLDRAAILTEIGRAHLTLGELEDAEQFAAQALEETQRTGDPVEAAEAQVVLGRVRLARGEVKPAVEGVRRALSTFRERGLAGREMQVAREFGLALKERGAHPEASEFLALVAESAVVAPAAAASSRVRN